MSQEILQIGHPTLRQIAKPLTQEEILSKETQKLIQEMCETMRGAPGVGLAAPQIGHALQIIVVEDKPEYTQNASEAELTLKQRKPIPFHVLINPQISSINEDEDKAEFFEGCLSVDGFIGIVPRFLSLKVEALNEKAEAISIHAHGWYARILQHEIDHLNGILCTERMKISTLMTVDNYLRYWLDKPIPSVGK